MQQTNSGAWRYRRRIPEGLQAILGKTEFVRKLGDSEPDALRHYPAVHHAVETILAQARATAAQSDPATNQGPFGGGDTPLSLRRRVEAHLLHEWGFDASGSGFGLDDQSVHPQTLMTAEQEQRDNAIEYGILERYREDPEQPPISDFDNVILELLSASRAPQDPPPTFSDAAKFYLQEKIQGRENEKKNAGVVLRVRNNLIKALKADPELPQLKRKDARNVRDFMIAQGVVSWFSATLPELHPSDYQLCYHRVRAQWGYQPIQRAEGRRR